MKGPGEGPWTLEDFLEGLSELGYEMESCLGGQNGTRYRCLFFHPTYCTVSRRN